MLFACENILRTYKNLQLRRMTLLRENRNQSKPPVVRVAKAAKVQPNDV